jgi:hypothetical protein
MERLAILHAGSGLLFVNLEASKLLDMSPDIKFWRVVG